MLHNKFYCTSEVSLPLPSGRFPHPLFLFLVSHFWRQVLREKKNGREIGGRWKKVGETNRTAFSNLMATERGERERERRLTDKEREREEEGKKKDQLVPNVWRGKERNG